MTELPGHMTEPLHRELRRAMRPQVDRLSAEIWFADYPFRQDPDAIRRQRVSLIAFLVAHGVAAEADDELANSPAIQVGPEADLDRLAALVAKWTDSPD